MRVLALAFVLVIAACGVPSSPTAQAEDVHSVAAEGALLAHDAAEGDTTAAFTRTHADALRKRLDALRPKIARAELARVEERVAAALQRLADDPAGADVERDLADAAEAAEELSR